MTFSYRHYPGKIIFGHLEDWYLGKTYDELRLISNRNEIFGRKRNVFLGFAVISTKKTPFIESLDLYRLLFNWSQQIGMTPKCWSIRDVMTIMVIQLINWNFLSVLWMTSLTPWMMIKLRVQMVSIYENCSEIFNWVKIFGIALVLHSFFYVHHARKSFDQNHSLFIKKKMKDENQWLFLTVYNFIQGYRPSLWMAKYHE